MNCELEADAVAVEYHAPVEAGSAWVVDSKDMPSLFAGGDSLAEARSLASQVIRSECGEGTSIVHLPVRATQPKEGEKR